MPFLSSSGISALNIIRGGAAGEAGTLLLDLYPNSSAAYSLRKLKTAYTGAAIEVRVDTTGQPTYDIGFDSNGDLDTADLLSKAGANDAYVKTWYDQSGNGNDAAQTTADEQPIIVSSGTIETSSSLPTVNFTNVSSNDGLEMTSRVSMGACFIAYNINDLNAINYGVGDDSTLGGVNSGLLLGGTFSGVNGLTSFNSTFLDLNNAETTGTTQLAVYDYSAGDVYLSNNGTALSNEGAQTQLSVKMLGARRPNFSSADSKISEVIIYSSSQSSNFSAITSNINTHYNIYWDGSQTGLLDDYPSPSAAYSLRALNSAYTGPLVRVRRSSDNAEQDIYALYDGTLDTEGLLSFTGAGDGFISDWYDQSGNVNNATQSAASRQPRIVNSGTIETSNSISAMKTLTTSRLDTSSISMGSSRCYFVVLERVGAPFGSYHNIVAQDTTPFYQLYANSSSVINYYDGTNRNTGATLTTSQSLITVSQNSSSGTIRLNGGEILSLASGASALNAAFNLMGFSTVAANAYFQEIIIYNSDESSNVSDIESNINNYYSIYP